MRAAAFIWCALVASSLLLVACPTFVERAEPESGAMDAASPQREGGAVTDAHFQSCVDGSHPDQPCVVTGGCDGGWTAYSSIVAPAWMAVTLDACVEHPSHALPQLYDDCPSIDLYGCNFPERNAVYCHGNRLTATCRVTEDCPAGWTCADQSQCEKACTGESPTECGRCDLKCHPTLYYCSTDVPSTPVACTSDCQCPFGRCEQGFCSDARGSLPNVRDFCAVDGTPSPYICACRGGTCRSDRCCVLTDGSIANWQSPECQPQ
jgi:hypothetical protein